MGPQPSTSTVSPSATRAFCTALTMVLMGSMKVASSKDDVVGQRYDAALRNPGHGFHVFAEAAAVWGEPAGQACGFVLLALRKKAAFAIKTIAAGDVMKAHHPVAQLPFGYAGADGDDCARQFVTQNLRRIYVRLEDFFDVGPADAAGRNFDQHFAVADVGDGNFFDAHDALFAINARVHGFRHRTQGFD